MAKKLRLTRPELKRHRDSLRRFNRYLPMLKLKQQMLQITARSISDQMQETAKATARAEQKVRAYRAVLVDPCGVDIERLAAPEKIETTSENIAGVRIPVFSEAIFTKPSYSLFATPPWVDGSLRGLRELNLCLAKEKVLKEQLELIRKELVTIIQRVNLFEKVKIPEAQEAIRRIRIHLGDEMTAAVGRAKIAKAKLTKSETVVTTGARP